MAFFGGRCTRLGRGLQPLFSQNVGKARIVNSGFHFTSSATTSSIGVSTPLRHSNLDKYNSRRHFCFSYPAPRELNDLIQLDLLKGETPERISEIWTSHHDETKTAVARILTPDEHRVLKRRSQEGKFFVYPVYRGENFFVLLSQFQDRFCLMTQLNEFQKNPATAQPYLTITMYEDLLESKGMVLLRADMSNYISYAESADLVTRMLDAYLKPEGFEKVECFNHTPREFDIDAYFASEKLLYPGLTESELVPAVKEVVDDKDTTTAAPTATSDDGENDKK